jgi:hypothetical protein
MLLDIWTVLLEDEFDDRLAQRLEFCNRKNLPSLCDSFHKKDIIN